MWRNVLLGALLAVFGTATQASAQAQPLTFNQPVRSTAAWTSATAANTAVVVPTTGFSSVMVTINGVAPIIDGVIAFEGDDGAGIWWPLVAVRVDTLVGDTWLFRLAPLNQAWEVDASGWAQVRVRLQSAITGSGTMNLGMTMSAAPALSAPVPPPSTVPTNTAAVARNLAATFLVGAMGRRVTSTGDALDVNIKYPPTTLDPCEGSKPVANAAISQTANAVVIRGSPGLRIFLCSLLVVGADAENLSFVEGTGTTCGTSTVAVVGATTAANGVNLAANGGFSLGNGAGAVGVTAVPGDDLCLFQSGAGRVAGNMTYAYAK